ncbi:putative cytochrome P450 [Durotheca rogersii]|uniref:putative cytochrome P450 n=1 Tax=Durotheca rogersii TaxID=419775 RepID=UPI002220C81B|nr:putative cytochrome P450 [Durotheca rogersii]KAI5862015.1 putative cytochrome P450 [Durotheca rogersii]
MNDTQIAGSGLQGFRFDPRNFDFELSYLNSVLAIAAVFLVRGVWLAVYRLFFSPIAKFPGPKLAALTTLYEAYYDLISKGGGQTAFRIKSLHEKYGPIVRVGPNELHIDDPEYYNDVYTKSTASRPIDKLEKYKHRFGMPEATISTVEGEKHRIRRAAIAPFFSKSRINGMNDTLLEIAERISYRLSTEYAGTGRPIDVCDMWGTLTADVVSELAFARCTRFSDSPDFKSPYSSALMSWVFAAHYTTHFNSLIQTMHWMPDRVLGTLVPSFKPILDYRAAIRPQVREMLAGKNMLAKESSHPTIFHDILASDLPKEELSFKRLTQEAMSLSGAGIETTMWTLSVATFHTLWNPSVEKRLVAELTEAMPDPANILPWSELEKLPFLSAVINECECLPRVCRVYLWRGEETTLTGTLLALRLSFGSVQRLPRVNRLASMKYGSWEIPAGTAVSMDAYHMHTNPDIFPNPLEFVPERWLGDPKGPDGVRPLSYYLVSFIRGSRVCIGMHLALMDMYVALAMLFRRHKLELFETDRSDVDFIVDLVRPMPKWDTKGVRIIVKS